MLQKRNTIGRSGTLQGYSTHMRTMMTTPKWYHFQLASTLVVLNVVSFGCNVINSSIAFDFYVYEHMFLHVPLISTTVSYVPMPTSPASFMWFILSTNSRSGSFHVFVRLLPSLGNPQDDEDHAWTFPAEQSNIGHVGFVIVGPELRFELWWEG